MYLDGKGGAENGKRVGMGMGMGPNCKHHLSHTDSVRLRLLLTLGLWGVLGHRQLALRVRLI